ncbi:GFA family protein [Vibrio parahaemolyticus]|nr:GFA family protein [Vibrio parahaemolyticus]WMN90544.1 GFA family protein [Vibrio parahaemolyticus]WMO08201.1 GFA family protein [Vibrio parahaemolyticus]
MLETFTIQCDCGTIEAKTTDFPITTGYCHCEDCRELRQLPFFPVVAFEKFNVEIIKGLDSISIYQHPTKRMTRVFCEHCGETLYNTNAMGWKVFSQQVMEKGNNGKLPPSMNPRAHFFYSRRIIDINDSLPKIG